MRFIEDIKGEIKKKGGNTTALFIYFKSAFDQHDILFNKMKKIGILEELINSIR